MPIPLGEILLVDDHDLFRATAIANLSLAGFSVRGASNGVEALRLLKESAFRPDLIISDFRMPQMGGLEFYQQLQRGEWAGIPVLFLTAQTHAQLAYVREQVGPSEVLSKVDDVQQLVARVKLALGARNALSQTNC